MNKSGPHVDDETTQVHPCLPFLFFVFSFNNHPLPRLFLVTTHLCSVNILVNGWYVYKIFGECFWYVYKFCDMYVNFLVNIFWWMRNFACVLAEFGTLLCLSWFRILVLFEMYSCACITVHIWNTWIHFKQWPTHSAQCHGFLICVQWLVFLNEFMCMDHCTNFLKNTEASVSIY